MYAYAVHDYREHRDVVHQWSVCCQDRDKAHCLYVAGDSRLD